MTGPQALPLTTLQEQFWFREMMHPGAGSHILTALLVWTGKLDEKRLREAVGALVRRHGSLRMRIAGGNQDPLFAQIDRQVEIDIVFEEADEAGFDGLGWELPTRVQDALAGTPFDLERGPIFRIRVYRFHDGLHAIGLAVHHIAADGWSVGVIARDLGRIYSLEAPSEAKADQESEGATVTALGPTGPVSPKKLAYWKKALDGAEPVLNLPGAKPRSPVRRGVGGVHVRKIDRSTATAVDALANEKGATVFTVCAAATAVLLGRLTGKSDIIAGVPLTNRFGNGDEDVVGLFANALPIRIGFDRETRFGELVDKSRAALVRALFHQDVPFERIVREINPVRDAGQHPIFQVVFNHFDFREPAFACDDFTIRLWPALHGGASFDLELHFVEHPDGLCLMMVYDRDLFDAEQVECWGDDFQSILKVLVAHPGRSVVDASLACADRPAARAPRAEPSVAATPRGSFATLHERILEQARRFPSEVAVECAGRTITYEELVRSAEVVADRLRAMGVGPDQFVPVYLERSVDLVAAILGVLMAGAAYVPIDPSQPPERIAFIVRDVAAVAIVTEESLAPRLPDRPARIFVDAASDEGAPAGGATDDRAPAATGENYAYCIYTSGSSGNPKGVTSGSTGAPNAVEGAHRSLAHFIAWQARAYGVDGSCRVAQLAPTTFDVSLRDIFLPLCTGGCVVVPDRATRRNPIRLRQWLTDSGVNLIHAVPSVFKLLVEELGAAPGTPFAAVEKVFFSGERLYVRDSERFREALPAGALIANFYGPSECTLIKTHFRLPAPGALDGLEVVPIGWPIDDCALHLSNGDGACAEGEVGEIRLRSDFLAKGYHRNPDLTAQRFAIADEGGAPVREYRTGDLGYRDAEGCLHFVGRRDDQVKINGYRVELGEVEHWVRGVEGVTDAAVLMASAPGRDPFLACIFTASREVTAAEVRSALARRLPGYMVPTTYLPLARLPLLASGKVDRKALAQRLGAGEAARSTS